MSKTNRTEWRRAREARLIDSPLPIHIFDLDFAPTCPECGTRTGIEKEISDTEQHHSCPRCKLEFIVILEE